jgi:hypothetical protein
VSPLIAIKPRDRQPGWLLLDMTDDPEVCAHIIVPHFGPDHNTGIDCWCHPRSELNGDGSETIIHEAAH